MTTMKCVVTTSEKIESTQSVDLTFPVFRQYEDTWIRWDENGDEWTIHEHMSEDTRLTEWSIEHERIRPPFGATPYNVAPESIDYFTGNGKYKCSEEEFAKALGEVKKFIARIG